MSLIAPILNERFMYRIFKSLVANPGLRWVNTYEVRNRTATGVADLKSAGLNIVAFEQALHTDLVKFEYFTVSTWVEDGDPYNPDTFVSENIGSPGERTIGTELAGLTDCLKVQFVPETGRMGFRLYRGVLAEGDITSPAGIKTLSNPAAMNLLLNTALEAIEGYFGTDPEGIVRLTMESTSNSRAILSANASGVTVKKLNNKYFNRTPAP